MGFRDDEMASRARVEVLERDLAALTEENELLKVRTAKHGNTALGRFALGVLLLAVCAIGLAVVAGWRVNTHGDDLGIALSVVGAVGVFLAAALGLISKLLIVVPPDKIIVISGRPTHDVTGRVRGYRIVGGGRAFRMPLVERVDELDGSMFSVNAQISNAYTAGNIPAQLHVRACVRVGRVEPQVHNAVERFLGRSSDEISTVAEETIEGVVRNVVSTLSLEQIQEDRDKVAELVLRNVDSDLDRLGLVIDTFHIIGVSKS